LKILEHSLIQKLKFISIFSIKYRDRNGLVKYWELISRKTVPKCISGKQEAPDAVIIVPIHNVEKKLCVIREFRIPIGAYEWGFPAGLVDSGESIEVAVERELFEETGLRLVRIIRQSPTIFSSAGVTDEAVKIVYVEAKGPLNTDNNQGSEDIECFLFDQENLKSLLEQNEDYFGARSWPILDNYARHGVDIF
jgi:ADP-ribose pyrophosphatase